MWSWASMTAVSSASVPEVARKLCFSRPGREPRERLGQLDRRDRRIERRDVREPRDLRDHRRVDLLVGVADGDGQDPAEEVEVLVAVGVLDPHALALGQDEGLRVVLDRRGKQELLVLLADARARVGVRLRSCVHACGLDRRPMAAARRIRTIVEITTFLSV